MPVTIFAGVSDTLPQSREGLREAPSGVHEFVAKHESTIATAFTIDHRWGLEPLCHLAASIALGRDLPPPAEAIGPLPRGAASLYAVEIVDEDAQLPFVELLHRAWNGVYLPLTDPELRGDGFEGVGSVGNLRQEMTEILGRLEPHVVKRSPAYVLEWAMASSLFQACILAEAYDLVVSLDHFYVPYTLGAPFDEFEAGFLGFLDVTGAHAIEGGRSVRVELASGYRYEISLEYIASWTDDSMPDEARIQGVEVEGVTPSWVILRLTNGRSLEFTTGAIMGWCEPLCSDFLEARGTARRKIERWIRSNGHLRVYPRAG